MIGGTLSACNRFVEVFSAIIKAPPDLARGCNLYLRTDHNAAYVRAQREFIQGDDADKVEAETAESETRQSGD